MQSCRLTEEASSTWGSLGTLGLPFLDASSPGSCANMQMSRHPSQPYTVTGCAAGQWDNKLRTTIAKEARSSMLGTLPRVSPCQRVHIFKHPPHTLRSWTKADAVAGCMTSFS